jgi:hypothetical protein
MAAKFVVTTAPAALTTAATKSLWLLDPVTNKITIFEMDVSMDAVTPLQAVRFDLYRATSLGTPAGTSTTPALIDPGDDQASTTTTLTNLTTEPTTATVLCSWYVQPCGGLLPLQLPLGREVTVPAGATTTGRIGLRYTTVTGVTPNCVANVWFDE